MDPATYGFIGTLVGAIVGATASVATTLIGSWNSTLLQIKADDLQRIERARTFQRDTLLKVQESLQDAMRNNGKMHQLDIVLYRETGSWQKSFLGDELNQQTLSVNRELSILTERVSNDELRNHIKEFRTQLSDCMFTISEDEGDLRIKQAMENFSPIMQHLGKVLRENY